MYLIRHQRTMAKAGSTTDCYLGLIGNYIRSLIAYKLQTSRDFTFLPRISIDGVINL
jgi:hypothetical protein